MSLKLLILADDFTGALDSGVQFAKAGIGTRVTTRAAAIEGFMAGDAQVLSVDLETRHLPPEQAAQRVREAARMAVEVGVPYLYKKIDSTLRGNVGSELAALLAVFPDEGVMLAPTFPDAGRTVREGVVYVSGARLEDTAFARDPLNPMRISSIADILRQTTATRVCVHRLEEVAEARDAVDLEPGCIHVFDAETEQDLHGLGARLAARDRLRLTAGSAGFAGVLCDRLGFVRAVGSVPARAGGTLILCGSVHAASVEQLQYAAAQGIPTFTLALDDARACELAASEALRAGGLAAIRTVESAADVPRVSPEEADRLAGAVAKKVAGLAQSLLARHDIGTLVIFGGDTLHAVMERLQCDTLEPVAEILPGVVASRLCGSGFSGYAVTKAGGFGARDVLSSILAWSQRGKG